MGGDIYSGPDTAADTRNFLLQSPDHAGADWVIETKVGGAELSGGYEHAGLLAYEDDGDYVKYDLISDDSQTAVNRIELRSEEGDVVQNPQPQFGTLPPGTTDAWLRLTKTGDVYKGEYSFDGQTWTALAETVQNDMEAPRFGLFTQGVSSPGGTVTFDYFSVDGETGCPGEEPENEAPVLGRPDGDADVRLRPAAGRLHGGGDGRRRGPADLQLGLRRRRDGGLVRAEPVAHLHRGGHVRRQGDGVRRQASASKTVTVSVLPAADPDARFRALVFSKTAGFRHSSIDEGIAAIKQLGVDHDFQVDATEDATAFRAGVLSQYDTVVFLSTTGDVLDDAQQAAFEDFVRPAAATPASTRPRTPSTRGRGTASWWARTSATTRRTRTRPCGPSTTSTSTRRSRACRPPDSRLDEWYNFQSPENPVVGGGGVDFSPRPDVHVLQNVDEASYDEDDGNTTDDDHPVTWCQRYDGGRSFYTAHGPHRGLVRRASANNILHPDPRRARGHGRRHARSGVRRRGRRGGGADRAGVRRSDARAPRRCAVNFSASGIDPDGGAIAEYKWTFSDGGHVLRVQRVAHVHDGRRVHRHGGGQGRRGRR